jgi:hypothetical protein
LALALTSPQALSRLGASLTARFNAELAAAKDHPGSPAARRFEAMFKIKPDEARGMSLNGMVKRSTCPRRIESGLISVSVTEKSTTPLAASDDGVRNRVKERLGYHPTSVEFPGLSPTGLGGGRSTHRLTRCSYHFLAAGVSGAIDVS